MLTCKVGENIINTIDYTDEQIRKWSKKGILKCPICDGELIYKNGEIKIAHFAHKDGEECEDIFGIERDTEEHLSSIRDIYERLKIIEKQNSLLSDVSLEYWIKSTRQRGDISFVYNGQRYVIEIQCSPLSTQYIERHRLYELSGIKDIWILGTEKYKDNKTVDGYFKTKEIERQLLYAENQNLFYYNYKTKTMSFVNEYNISALLDRKTTFDFDFINIKIDDFSINNLIDTHNVYTNSQNIVSWFNENLKQKCDICKYNHYLSLINKEVLVYFEIKNKKYTIDYINGYVSLSDYEEILSKYDDLKIKPIIFLNYKFYKHALREGIDIYSKYSKVGFTSRYGDFYHKSIYEFIDLNSLFVEDTFVYSFKEDYTLQYDYEQIVNNKIECIYLSYSEKEDIFKELKDNDSNITGGLLKFTKDKINEVKNSAKKSIVKCSNKIFSKNNFNELSFKSGKIYKNKNILNNVDLIEKKIDELDIQQIVYKKIKTIIEDDFINRFKYEINYKFDKFFNKDIKLSFRKVNEKYIYLPRYDFVKAIDEINKILTEIDNFKMNYINNFIKADNNLNEIQYEITSEEINKKIYRILYPMIYVANRSENDILEFRFNVDFTKGVHGGLKLWIIKDFIENLNELEITNVENII